MIERNGTLKVGDKIVCIDPSTTWGSLTKGRTYKVDRVTDDPQDTLWFAVECDDGISYWYYPRQFELALPAVEVQEGWSL